MYFVVFVVFFKPRNSTKLLSQSFFFVSVSFAWLNPRLARCASMGRLKTRDMVKSKVHILAAADAMHNGGCSSSERTVASSNTGGNTSTLEQHGQGPGAGSGGGGQRLMSLDGSEDSELGSDGDFSDAEDW